MLPGFSTPRLDMDKERDDIEAAYLSLNLPNKVIFEKLKKLKRGRTHCTFEELEPFDTGQGDDRL
jgi:hypothetical protein